MVEELLIKIKDINTINRDLLINSLCDLIESD